MSEEDVADVGIPTFYVVQRFCNIGYGTAKLAIFQFSGT